MSVVYFPPTRKSPIVDFDKHELAAVIRGIVFPSEIAQLASNFMIDLNVSGRQFLELDEKHLLALAKSNQRALEILQNLQKSPPHYLTALISSRPRWRPSSLAINSRPAKPESISYDNMTHDGDDEDLFTASSELQEAEECEAFDFSSDDEDDHPPSLCGEAQPENRQFPPNLPRSLSNIAIQTIPSLKDQSNPVRRTLGDASNHSRLVDRPMPPVVCTENPNKADVPCDVDCIDTYPSCIIPPCLPRPSTLKDATDRSLNVSETCCSYGARNTSILSNSEVKIKICQPTLPVISTSSLTNSTSQNTFFNQHPATDTSSDLRIICTRQRGRHLSFELIRSDADSRVDLHPISVLCLDNRDGASSINIPLAPPTPSPLISNLADGMNGPNPSRAGPMKSSVVCPSLNHEASQLAGASYIKDESNSNVIHPISTLCHDFPTSSIAICGKSGTNAEPLNSSIEQQPSHLGCSEESWIYEPISSFNFTNVAGVPETVPDPSNAEFISLPCHRDSGLAHKENKIDLGNNDRPKESTSAILALPTFAPCQDPNKIAKMSSQASSSTLISERNSEGTSPFKYCPTAEEKQILQYKEDVRRIKFPQFVDVFTPSFREPSRPSPDPPIVLLSSLLPSLSSSQPPSVRSPPAGSRHNEHHPVNPTKYYAVGNLTNVSSEEAWASVQSMSLSTKACHSVSANPVLASSEGGPLLESSCTEPTLASRPHLSQCDHVISDKAMSPPTAIITRSGDDVLSSSDPQHPTLPEVTSASLLCDTNGDTGKSTVRYADSRHRMVHPGFSPETPMIKLDSHVPDDSTQNVLNLGADSPEVGAMLGHFSQQQEISSRPPKIDFGTVPKLRPALHFPIDLEDRPNFDLISDWMAVSDAQDDTFAKLSLSDIHEFSLPVIPLSPPFSQELSSSLGALSFDHSLNLSRITADLSPKPKPRHCLSIPSRSMPRTLWPTSNDLPHGSQVQIGPSHAKGKNMRTKSSAFCSPKNPVSPSYASAGTQTDHCLDVLWEMQICDPGPNFPPRTPSSSSTLLPSDPSLLRELYKILGSSQRNGAKKAQEESPLAAHPRTCVNITSKGLLPSFQGPMNGISKGGGI